MSARAAGSVVAAGVAGIAAGVLFGGGFLVGTLTANEVSEDAPPPEPTTTTTEDTFDVVAELSIILRDTMRRYDMNVRHLCAALDEEGSDSTDPVVLEACR